MLLSSHQPPHTLTCAVNVKSVSGRSSNVSNATFLRYLPPSMLVLPVWVRGKPAPLLHPDEPGGPEMDVRGVWVVLRMPWGTLGDVGENEAELAECGGASASLMWGRLVLELAVSSLARRTGRIAGGGV
jgi:hypothetical protein